MIALADAIDRLNRAVAALVRWLVVAMAVIQFANVVLRHVFSLAFIAMNEAVWYLHGLFFGLGAGYVLACDAHVRIDILYGRLPAHLRARIDFAGALFLLIPVCIAIVWFSRDFVATSWRIGEGSAEFGGLPLLYLLKTAVWGFAVLLGLQALAAAIRAAARMRSPAP